MKQQTFWSLVLSSSLALLGCQAPVAMQPFFAIELPATLVEPESTDWRHQLVAGTKLGERRAESAKRRVQAFPVQPANWPVTMQSGFGLTSTDTLTNGPAAIFNPIVGAAYASDLQNKIFMVTKEGSFIKADRATPSTYSKIKLTGGTFSRTYVTISPKGTRAYVLSDNGTLYIVDTLGAMRYVSIGLGGSVPSGASCKGIAPAYDPYTSDHGGDLHDEVYLPMPNGRVLRYDVSVDATGAWPPTYSQTGDWDLASTTSTIVAGEPNKIKASAIVLDRKVYVGDQGGYFHRLDTVTAANTVKFSLGAPINTPPSLEFNAANVIDHAFVNVGATCAWIQLSTAAVTFSRPLFLDDGENAAKTAQGNLWDYKYSASVNSEYLAAQDALTINTESPDYNLPLADGTSPSIRYVKELVPSETNTRSDGTNPLGGPTLGYVRWNSAATYAPGTIVQKIVLRLRSNLNNFYSRVPEIRTTDHLVKGSTTTKWSSDAMTNATRPDIGSADVGQFIGQINNDNNTRYVDNDYSLWDVTSAFSTLRADYALALKMNAGGDAVLWPWGPFGQSWSPPGQGKKAYQVNAPQFFNNVADQATTSSAKVGNKSEKRPVLEIQTAKAAMPTPSIETPPLIDANRQRIYVFYTNAVYSISFASASQFADSEYDSVNNTGTRYTYFVTTKNGDRSVDSSIGSTYDSKKKFVGNFTAPALDPNPTPSYIYALDRYPTALDGSGNATSWKYAINRFSLPLSPTANTKSSAALATVAEGKEAGSYMIVDGNSQNVYFGLGDGKAYQFEP